MVRWDKSIFWSIYRLCKTIFSKIKEKLTVKLDDLRVDRIKDSVYLAESLQRVKDKFSKNEGRSSH